MKKEEEMKALHIKEFLFMLISNKSGTTCFENLVLFTTSVFTKADFITKTVRLLFLCFGWCVVHENVQLLKSFQCRHILNRPSKTKIHKNSGKRSAVKITFFENFFPELWNLSNTLLCVTFRSLEIYKVKKSFKWRKRMN